MVEFQIPWMVTRDGIIKNKTRTLLSKIFSFGQQ